MPNHHSPYPLHGSDSDFDCNVDTGLKTDLI